jgi:hypothetical protein
MNQSGGLQRLTSANGPRSAPTGPPPPGGPIRGGIRGPLRGPIRVGTEERRNRCRSSWSHLDCRANSAVGRVREPKSASARPGPCTWPRLADALTRREYHPARQASASSSFVLGRRPRTAGTARGQLAACGRSTLTPGRAGWSRGHGSGVPPDAQRHPPGEGVATPGCRQSRRAEPLTMMSCRQSLPTGRILICGTRYGNRAGGFVNSWWKCGRGPPGISSVLILPHRCEVGC